MKQSSQIIIALLFLAVIFPLAGCGKSGRIPGLVRCEGTVRWNGEPVEGAQVSFHPNDPNGRGGFGVTDAHGKFKTTTLHVNDGIEPGEYLVTVKKMITVRETLQPPAQTDPNDLIDDRIRDAARGPERSVDTHYIPQVYSSKETSGLTAVVPPRGTRDLLFELVGEITNEPVK